MVLENSRTPCGSAGEFIKRLARLAAKKVRSKRTDRGSKKGRLKRKEKKKKGRKKKERARLQRSITCAKCGCSFTCKAELNSRVKCPRCGKRQRVIGTAGAG